MSRALHRRDYTEHTDLSLPELLKREAQGDVLAIAPEDERLSTLIEVSGSVQQRLTQTQSALPEAWDTHVGSFPDDRSEQFPIESHSYDTVVFLTSLQGIFDRPAPFLDTTRIAKAGGTVLSATGLQPGAKSDRDFKAWVPESNRLVLEQIFVVGGDGYATPDIVSTFTRTSDHLADSQR